MTSATIPFLAKTKLTRPDDQLRMRQLQFEESVTDWHTDQPTHRPTEGRIIKWKRAFLKKLFPFFENQNERTDLFHDTLMLEPKNCIINGFLAYDLKNINIKTKISIYLTPTTKLDVI